LSGAPALEGDRSCAARTNSENRGGFVLFPKEAPWLETYLQELLLSERKYDDQVDSTVFALAWLTLNPEWLGGLTKA